MSTPLNESNEPDGEASYARCLLTTLAKSDIVSITLHPGRSVPLLAPLASNDDERQWTAGLPFQYEMLDAGKVIALLLLYAGYRFYHWRGRRYELRTTLVTSEGERHVRFAIVRGGGPPSGPITVTKMP